MQQGLVVVVFLALLAQFAASQFDMLPAVQFGGFDIIWSNDTSYLDEIDSHGEVMYVSGNGIVREVRHNPFSLEYQPKYFQQQHRFIDFRVFNDTNSNTWVFGPITAHHAASNVNGYSHPLQLASLTASYTQNPLQPGTMYSSAYVHTSNVTGNSFAYVVGWVLSTTIVNLVVNRLNLSPETASSGTFYTPIGNDVVLNGTTGYDDFYRLYKPKIFRAGNPLYYLLIVDPSSHCIYKALIPQDDMAGTPSITLDSTLCLPFRFGGSAFDSDSQLLYVAQVTTGTAPGSITVINTVTLLATDVITLQEYQSNPVALTFHNGFLYVGFNGGPALLKYDRSNGGMTQYSTVPTYLRAVQAVHARHSSLYFVTYDQFAKVGKASESHFCLYMCDRKFGYCENRECKCVNGTTLNADGKTCDLTPVEIHDKGVASHAGEIALGLLFVVTFIAGAVGWFLLWRSRRSAAPKSGYAAAATEEHDRFLGDD